MAPPLYPKMVSTPSSASTCTIMSAPFMVAPARGCFLAAGSARLSFEDDIGSPSGGPSYTADPARLRRSAGGPGRRLPTTVRTLRRPRQRGPRRSSTQLDSRPPGRYELKEEVEDGDRDASL